MTGEIILKLDPIIHKVIKAFYKFNTALCKELEQVISRDPSPSKLFHDSLTAALFSIGFKVPAALVPSSGANSPSLCGDSPDVSHAVVSHFNPPCVDWSLLRANWNSFELSEISVVSELELVVKDRGTLKSYSENNAGDEQDLTMNFFFPLKALIEKLNCQQFYCFICPPTQLSAWRAFDENIFLKWVQKPAGTARQGPLLS